MTTRAMGLVLAAALALAACWIALELAGVLLWCAVTGLAWLVGRQLVARLSGLTGDGYGALNELAELAALTLAPLCLRLMA